MVEQLLENTESELILESPWLRRIRAAAAETARAGGRAEGRAEGLAEGERLGLQRGEQIGRGEGEHLGRVAALRQTIQDVALARLTMSGLDLARLQQVINGMEDEARLRDLLRATALAHDFQELAAALA